VALELYNEESQAFEKEYLANKDIDCFTKIKAEISDQIKIMSMR